MKIRKFNESEEIDISSERIQEIADKLKDLLSNIEEKNNFIESLEAELNNYKSQSKKGNDQIDDSISALQIIKKNIDEVTDKVDTVINNLVDYDQKGRNFLYSEK